MMKMKVLAIAWLLAVQVLSVQAHGPKTEGEKKQARFFMCIRSIEHANEDGDDELTRPEYQPFIKALSVELFDDSILEKDELPRDLGHIYKQLISDSGAKWNARAINIYGAELMKLPYITKERYDQLHKMCETVMKELARLGPQTDAPIQLAVDLLSEAEFEEEEEEEDGDGDSGPDQEIEMNTELISVHSSFVIHNTKSITKHDMEIGHDSILYEVYVDFINDLMDTMCPLEVPCPKPEPKVADQEDLLDLDLVIEAPPPEGSEDNNSTGTRYLEEVMSSHRRLCEDHHWRRMLCGEEGRRRLGGIFEDADLYEVKDLDCPEELKKHGHEHGVLPHCHTVYAHYDVLVEKPAAIQFKAVEMHYTAATKKGIFDGMLQKSLKKIDPRSPFTVLGPGKYRYPYENTHHMAHEADTKPPKKVQHDSYLRV